MGILWPAEDVKKLKALWSDGVMVPQIQIKFGQKYSTRGIYNKAHNLHLAKRAPGERFRRKTPKPQQLSENMVAADMAHAHGEPIAIGPIGDYPKQPACRWPHGTGLAFQYCGHPLSAPSPYCSHHRARAWVRPHNLTVRGAK